MKVLFIDDEPKLLEKYVRDTHSLEDVQGFSQEDGQKAVGWLKKNMDCDVALIDSSMPGGWDGLKTGAELMKVKEDLICIMLTGHDISRNHARTAMRTYGFFDHVLKAEYFGEQTLKEIFDSPDMRKFKKKSAAKKTLKEDRFSSKVNSKMVIGSSPAMQQMLETLRIITQKSSRTSVLITGETGVGKELVASFIHNETLGRKIKSFEVVDLGIIPEKLQYDALFGHNNGAFDGADKDLKGAFERADGGTLFLDEIHNVSFESQGMLIRVLQENCFLRLGAEKSTSVDVRVVVGTNQNLEELVANKAFREDLFFRFDRVVINVPPLRERREDILPLAEHFLAHYKTEMGDEMVVGFSLEVKTFLLDYHWPGNVRELQHAVEHAVLFAKGTYVEMQNFKPELLKRAQGSFQSQGKPTPPDIHPPVQMSGQCRTHAKNSEEMDKVEQMLRAEKSPNEIGQAVCNGNNPTQSLNSYWGKKVHGETFEKFGEVVSEERWCKFLHCIRSVKNKRERGKINNNFPDWVWQNFFYGS